MNGRYHPASLSFSAPTPNPSTRRYTPYEVLKADLWPFCDAMGIPREALSKLFEPYGVTHEYISLKSWTDFYEDEFFADCPVVKEPISLDKHNADILRQFANSIRFRAGPNMSDMWSFVRARNPGKFSPPQIRLSAFCYLVKELDLGFKIEELVDALLAFFGKDTAAISFPDFAFFMYTFD
jgi:hypothetical protein